MELEGDMLRAFNYFRFYGIASPLPGHISIILISPEPVNEYSQYYEPVHYYRTVDEVPYNHDHQVDSADIINLVPIDKKVYYKEPQYIEDNDDVPMESNLLQELTNGKIFKVTFADNIQVGDQVIYDGQCMFVI